MNTEVNNILHILVRDEKTWLSMAEEISSNSKIPAKDLLHDFYIALHSKIDSKKVKINDILYNDSLNKAFIYKMMHNIFIDTIRVDKDLLIDKDLKNIIEAINILCIILYINALFKESLYRISLIFTFLLSILLCKAM